MKINILYCPIRYYPKHSVNKWVWMFERYKYVRGFKIRIFGIYINVREKNATYKLMKLLKNNM